MDDEIPRAEFPIKQGENLTKLTVDLLIDAYNMSRMRLQMSKLHIMSKLSADMRVYDAMSNELDCTYEVLSREISHN